MLVSEKKELAFTYSDGYVTYTIPYQGGHSMVAISAQGIIQDVKLFVEKNNNFNVYCSDSSIVDGRDIHENRFYNAGLSGLEL